MQNLSIGSSGQAVIDLQKELNAHGASLTVDGKFGPATQAALKQFQQANGLTADGIYGPKTSAVLNPYNTQTGQLNTGATAPKPISSTPSTSSQTSTPTQTQTSSQSNTPVGIVYDPNWAKYGITQDAWNKLNATQQGTIAAAMGGANSLYSANGNSVTVDQALKAAANDPQMMAQFTDSLKLDTKSFQDNLNNLQVQTSTQMQNYQTQFENERKQLAEQQAAAGTAYSGFRGKAQKDLAQQEAGIVTSSRSQLQRDLNQTTSQFESKYGTASTPSSSISFTDPLSGGVSISGLKISPGDSTGISGQTTGGITGSQPYQQQQAVTGEASTILNLGKVPDVISP